MEIEFSKLSKYIFKDYDKLRLGLCLEDEFKAGVDLFTRKFLHLSNKQLNDLTNFYRVPDDGRIYYRAFTDLIENSKFFPQLNEVYALKSSSMLDSVVHEMPNINIKLLKSLRNDILIFWRCHFPYFLVLIQHQEAGY